MADPILIIGAGVSGLALAQGLLLHNIPFRIFERDAELHARAQGYRFRISEEGIEALRQNVTPESFAKLERCCRAQTRTSTGNIPQVHLDAKTATSTAPLVTSGQLAPASATGESWSVDRAALRSVLSVGLDSHLEYGKRLKDFEADEDGVTIVFKDGSTARGRLPIGADGAWSKVRRRILPSHVLVDTEGRLIFGRTEITETFAAEFSQEAATGMTLIRDSENGLPCLLEWMRFNKDEQNAPHDYVYWVLFLRKDKHMPDKEMLQLPDSEVAQLARNVTSSWHPRIRCLFDNFTASITRVVSVRPPIPSCSAGSRVTLMGDAIHAMVPTAAYGATSALRDAGALTRLLSKPNLREDSCYALREYEAQIKHYAEEALQRSSLGGKMMFGMRAFDELSEIE